MIPYNPDIHAPASRDREALLKRFWKLNPRVDNTVRDEAIWGLHQQGWDLRQIGTLFALSERRVRDILKYQEAA